MTPTDHVHSLGRICDRKMKSAREEVIGYTNEYVWEWEREPWAHDGDA
jgi:hypothetical protein